MAFNTTKVTNGSLFCDNEYEYIKSSLLKDIVAVIANNRCNCVTDIIIDKMADKYSLEELETMRDQPIHSMQAIGKLISDNANKIRQHCLP